MKLTKLTIRNFEGLESLEITPADLTVIEGHNGAGKTSVLDAIRVAFTNKGERSLLVHEGAEGGLILFELSDGTLGERQVVEGGRVAGQLTLTQGGKTLTAAQRFLDRLGLGFGFNPLAFVGLPAHEQTKKLLEVTPLNITPAQLIMLGGGALPGVTYSDHPLLVLKAIEAALEEQRRTAGRDARDTEGMVERLRAEVPADFDRDAAQAFDLGAAVQTLNHINGIKRELERINTECADRARRISELYMQARQLEADQANAENASHSLGLELETLPAATELEAAMTAYKQNQLYLSRLNEAAERERVATALRNQYAALTATIDIVRAKPAELLADGGLPVQGLGIAEGQVTINGLPISALSTGEQLDVAVDIAIATLGDLKVVLVDGLERLDESHQQRMLSRLTQAGVQAFVTRVTDSELTVITDVEMKGVSDEELPF